jgi:hypothetical protein
MLPLSDIRQRIQKLLGDGVSQVSSAFIGLSSGLQGSANSADLQKRVDKLFKMLMESNRMISGEVNALLDVLEKNDQRFAQVSEEKHRLEVLYTSGILFSSETELKPLMERAIDVVVRELGADQGFIVLVDDRGEPDTIFSRNMNPDEHPEAREMSTTVIWSTIAHSRPVQDTV